MAIASTRLNACVIGAGSWGTALAHHLAGAGHQARLWAHEPEVALAINQQHENTVFLPGAPPPPPSRPMATWPRPWPAPIWCCW
jgi:glycerol-3-phosphate dehydrogenase